MLKVLKSLVTAQRGNPAPQVTMLGTFSIRDVKRLLFRTKQFVLWKSEKKIQKYPIITKDGVIQTNVFRSREEWVTEQLAAQIFKISGESVFLQNTIAASQSSL